MVGRGPQRSRGTFVGVDIGAWGIKAAEVAVNGKKARVVRTHQVPAPSGAIFDGGVAEGREHSVATALRELWNEAGFSTRNVIFGWESSTSVRFETFPAAGATVTELRSNVDLTMKAKGMGRKEAWLHYDFGVLDGNQVAHVTSVRRRHTETWGEVFRVAGLRLRGGEPTMLAALRASAIFERPEAFHDVLMDLGDSVATTVIHSQGLPVLMESSTILTGRNASAVVASRMGVAEVDLATVNLTDPKTPLGEAFATHIRAAAARLGNEIVNLGWNVGANNYSSVRITGGVSSLPGVTDALSAALGGVPVSAAEYAEWIVFDHEDDADEGFLAAVGLGLGSVLR